MELDSQKLEIEYPCEWSYTVIGKDQERLQLAVAIAVGGEEHDLELSHRSSKGQYVSLKLRMQVRDESHRRELFQRLGDHEDVRFVL